MLRESSKFEPVDPPPEPGASAARSASPSEASQARTKEVDLRAVTRGGAHDSGVPLGRELVALAESAGLRVQPVPRAHEADPPVASGVVRIRGEIRSVLVSSDSLAERIGAVTDGLRTHASDFLESRHLPPALRARLDPLGPAGAEDA